jgi:hypothetical protein
LTGDAFLQVGPDRTPSINQLCGKSPQDVAAIGYDPRKSNHVNRKQKGTFPEVVWFLRHAA